MTNIILTTPEELRAIVSETVSQSLAGFTQPRNEPDNLTPDVAVEVLERHGFLISKARLYKLTAKKEVPFRKYGNKLLFSRKELLTWAENLAKRVNDKDEAALAIAKSANRKIRNYGKYASGVATVSIHSKLQESVYRKASTPPPIGGTFFH